MLWISKGKLATTFKILSKLYNRSFCLPMPYQPIREIRFQNSWSYDIPQQKIKGISSSKEGNYVIFYTCKQCETKQNWSFSKNSYHYGVVIVWCEGCQGLHLIADNLKWFEDNNLNIEDLVNRNNETMIKIDNTNVLAEQLSTMLASWEQQDKHKTKLKNGFI